MKNSSALIVLLALATLALGQSAEQSPWNPSDAEFRQMIGVWTRVVDDTYLHAVNKGRLTGEKIDPDTEIEPFLRTLARNRYFDVNRESGLHPSYLKYIHRIAALRGQPLAEPRLSYQIGLALGKYGVPLIIVALLIRGWTGRISRKTSTAVGGSRQRYYGLLLLKMSWRVLILFMLSMFLVVLAHMPTAISEREAGEAGALAFILLLIVCPPVLLMSAWTQTKRRFAESAEHPASAGRRFAEPAEPSRHSVEVSAAKETPTEQSAQLHRVTESFLLLQQPETAVSHSSARNKLNGWQRLWIVLAVVWATLVLLFIFNTAPTEKSIKAGWANAIVELGQKTNARNETPSQYRQRAFGGRSDEEIIRFGPLPTHEMDKDGFDPSRAVPADEFIAINSNYAAQLSVLPRVWSKTLVSGLLVWAIPLGALYLIGRASHWIYVGFRKAPTRT